MDKTTFRYTPATYPMTEVDETALPDSRDKPGMPSSVITIASYSPQPQDHVLWSVFNTLYMNFCCLGFLALVFSVKARDRKVLGDMNGASSYGSTAKYLNIAALVLTILFIILIIILTATGIIKFASSFHEDDYPWGHRNGK